VIALQPTPQKIRPEHAQMLEKYAWESNGTSSPGMEYFEYEATLTIVNSFQNFMFYLNLQHMALWSSVISYFL
jgi:hypothetical protein